MTYSLADAFSFLRPEDEVLSEEEKARTGAYRFGTLLGAALILLFGTVQEQANPAALDPIAARLAISGGLVGLFLASYVSSWLRHRYVVGIWVIFYLHVGWVALLAIANQFDGDYSIELVFAQAALGIAVGLGAVT